MLVEEVETDKEKKRRSGRGYKPRRPPENTVGFEFKVIATQLPIPQIADEDIPVKPWAQEVEAAKPHFQKPAYDHPEILAVEKNLNEFKAAMAKAMPYLTFDQMRLLTADPAFLEQTLAKLAERWPAAVVEKPSEDILIKVDRTALISYGLYVYRADEKNVIDRDDLENTGPAEYKLASIETWLHPAQLGDSVMSGKELYQYLESSKLIDRALGWRDGLELQKLPLEVFRRTFSQKVLYLYRSVLRNPNGLFVPYVCDTGDRIALKWITLERSVFNATPAALFGEGF